MHTTLREHLATEEATKRAAMVEFMRAALYGQTEQIAKQGTAALNYPSGPSTTDLVNLMIAAARGANVADQALALLGRIAFTHSEFHAGV